MSRPLQNFTFFSNQQATGTSPEYTNIQGETIGLEIFGSGVGTKIWFEAKMNEDGNWNEIPAVKQKDFTVATNTTGMNEVWNVSIGANYKFRLRIETYGSGVINAKAKIIASA